MNRSAAAPRVSTLDETVQAAAVWYVTSLIVLVGISLGSQFVSARAAGSRPAGLLQVVDKDSASWYRRIVVEGYSYERGRPSTIGYFPVYPLLARGLAAVTGLQGTSALLVVSNLSLLGAFVLLPGYLKARAAGGGPAAVEWTLVALGLFPTSFFFRLSFSESTLLLLALLTMYALCPRAAGAQGAPKWALPVAVFLAGLASATRPTGVALLAPLAVHVWQSQATVAARARRAALCLPLACWGLLAFMAYQYVRFGDPLAFVEAQMYWRWGPRAPWSDKLASLVTAGPLRAPYDPTGPAYWAGLDPHGVPWLSIAFANPVYFVAAVAALGWGAWKRWLTKGEIALTLALLLIPYITKGHEVATSSMGRYVAVAFPLYIVAGRLAAPLPRALAVSLVALAACLLVSYCALFAAGYSFSHL